MRKLLVNGFICMMMMGCTQKEADQPAKASEPTAEAADSNKGVGPVKSLTVESDIKKSLADQGEQLFSSKCSACHKVGERYVGPALKGVTQRRKPEWIMNMILNPQEMVQKDSTAQGLLAEYLVPMTFQNLTQDEARSILEYFRSVDADKQASTKN